MDALFPGFQNPEAKFPEIPDRKFFPRVLYDFPKEENEQRSIHVKVSIPSYLGIEKLFCPRVFKRPDSRVVLAGWKSRFPCGCDVVPHVVACVYMPRAEVIGSNQTAGSSSAHGSDLS